MNERSAIVTGAARGIGRQYAQALADAGAAIVVADLDAEGAEETAAIIEKDGGRAVAVQVDVSDRQGTLDLAAAATEAFGRIDILVNNAAIYHSMRNDPQLSVDIDYWRKVFAVNLDGALLCTQAVAPSMIEAGWGRIVNQSSIGAYINSGPGGHYCVSKLALVGLTQGFASELGPHGITCNAIAPGPIFTEATRVTVDSGVLEQMVAQQPLQKELMPEDLVGTLLYLVSDAAAFVTGQTIIVDGGLVKHL